MCFSLCWFCHTGSSSSSSHMSSNDIDNRPTSHEQAHDSNSINQNFTNQDKQPHFDHSMPRNVTLKVGETAFLSCRVKQLGDKLVSFLLCYLYLCLIRAFSPFCFSPWGHCIVFYFISPSLLLHLSSYHHPSTSWNCHFFAFTMSYSFYHNPQRYFSILNSLINLLSLARLCRDFHVNILCLFSFFSPFISSLSGHVVCHFLSMLTLSWDVDVLLCVVSSCVGSPLGLECYAMDGDISGIMDPTKGFTYPQCWSCGVHERWTFSGKHIFASHFIIFRYTSLSFLSQSLGELFLAQAEWLSSQWTLEFFKINLLCYQRSYESFFFHIMIVPGSRRRWLSSRERVEEGGFSLERIEI